MARREVLTTVKDGISRLRTKGAALKDVLFDLVNGFVTSARTVKIRPGTFLDETLPAGTKGLTSFDGSLHVFAANNVAGIPAGYTLNLLKSPDGDLAVSEIHFAEPFLGFLYVVAEFSDGNIYHFWLRSGTTWVADTEYDLHELASPTVVNGFAYKATRLGNPLPSWTANAPRAVDDIIEPTVYNGFFYKAVELLGAEPRSGDVEPVWPTNAGDFVIEDTDGTLRSSDGSPTLPEQFPGLQDAVQGRYVLRFLQERQLDKEEDA